MNYFGMFFSFLLPGVVLGALITAGAKFESRGRNKK